MEEHNLLINFIIEIFNKAFGWVAILIYKILGKPVPETHHLIPAHIVYVILVSGILTVFLYSISRKKEFYPSPLQSFAESIVDAFRGLLVDLMGEEGKRYLPMIGTIGLFIFFNNLAGLFPGFISPTSNLNVTVGSAIFVFLYYHYTGIKKHGVLKYIKHFAGPYPWLAPLFFPIEVISHFSRPLSLSVRLFGNIRGEDTVIMILAFLIPYIVPLPMMALAVFTSFVQALVFTLLAAVYIAGAIEESEEH